MKKRILIWVIGSLLIVAVLMGAYLIIEKNRSAALGPEHERAPLYSH